ncbi:MAG: MGMT family protein [bacterium]|nr:MGMT family protein [bacterium]
MPKPFNFTKKVYQIVAKIKPGETLTYKQVATLADRHKAYRAVGNILNKNYRPEIPCHRVIRSDGGMGGYNRGVGRKVAMLRAEAKRSPS